MVKEGGAVIRPHSFQVQSCTAFDNCAKPSVNAEFEKEPVQKPQDSIVGQEIPNNNVYNDEEESVSQRSYFEEKD